MLVLVTLNLLPLLVIGIQIAFDLDQRWGVVGYSLYKVCFLVPPIIYCRIQGISISDDIFKWRNWRGCLKPALYLGGLAVLIFWGVYFTLGDFLLDKGMIAGKLGDQFRVTAGTVLLIAPVTVFANSLLEEFFYRGFAFGLLVKKNRWIGYLLPAGVFTVHHMLFIHHWLTPLPFAIAVIGLLTLSLVLEFMYEKAESIVAPWIIHIFGDVAMMAIAVTMLW